MGPIGVYSLDEIARAAGVTEAQARAASRAPGPLSFTEAVALGRTLVAARRAATVAVEDPLFVHSAPTPLREPRGVPLLVSGSLHAVLLATIVSAFGFHTSAAARSVDDAGQTPLVHLIFLATPGPGGGGGGGGRLERSPASKAELKARNHVASPAPPQTPTPVALQAHTDAGSPSIAAPVVSAPNDDRDRSGVLAPVPPRDESAGAGRGGGAGTGTGAGLGEGDGSGIGPGTGGGVGGGAYRPGSGITPPRVVREVKADYTEEARRRGVTGEVVMEVLVRRDGSVGDVRLLQGLGLGLDERAAAAVRQWRFAPAERQGIPVDVVVEVGVEFKLR